ncbi:2,5-diketo-D-gluconate reductase A [Kineococcus xinjiangensis]|uniref:2,5-diketo-D-gluconate reductase A n=1 Tax=Kineococcus xinjiangensis TaxID=512762 RepID=A0A2S6IHS5_9ACTN|nr:aldo/keto reductase [Kineococcus xinjiangensis]PPK93769.1 2,5-diketo-D-gluconate reductase A [Kineococcus xinjiangensis]
MSAPAAVPTATLNTGATVPQLGLGTARAGDAEIRRTVAQALELGYRLIDTASRYGNERGVGQGIADSGLPREEVFVSTKLRGAEQGHAEAKDALHASLDRLGLDHVDLFLVHWPLPRLDRYVESWHAMEELRAEGLTRAIGVSNFLPEHLDRLRAESGTVPAVNQIEMHPRLPQEEQRADNARRGIVTEAWSPLAAGEGLLDEPALVRTAERLDVTPAQVVLAWHLHCGVVTFPAAFEPDLLRQNLAAAQVVLDAGALSAVASLASGERIHDQDPATFEEY